MFNKNANPALSGINPQNGGNPFDLLSRFQQFKKNITGDPRQQVQDLLNSGKMSQEQFNQISQMAKSFQGFLK